MTPLPDLIQQHVGQGGCLGLTFDASHPTPVLITDNHAQLSRASLRIRILDVNDNPPELATPYEAAVCEDAKPGQVPLRGWGLRVAAMTGQGTLYPRPKWAWPHISPYPILTLQLIQTISVVDRDEPQGGHRFYFRLVPEAPSNPHFSLLDIQGELLLNPQILACTEGGA